MSTDFSSAAAGDDEGRPTLQLHVGVNIDPVSDLPVMPWLQLAEAVAAWRAEGLLTRFFFVRKPPGLRLRFQADRRAELEPVVAAWAAELEDRGTVRSARFAIYEPETARFGGLAGTAVVEDWFGATAQCALAYECLEPHRQEAAPRVLVGLSLVDDLVRGVVDDDAERWEVWSALERLTRPLPGAHEVDLGVIEACLSRDERLRAQLESSMGSLMVDVFGANRRVSKHLRALARFDRLDVGPRAWLTAAIPFLWNHLGLPLDPAVLRATVAGAAEILGPESPIEGAELRGK